MKYSVEPGHVRVEYDPLRVRVAGYSSTSLLQAVTSMGNQKSSFFAAEWRHFGLGSRAWAMFSIAMLVFRYETPDVHWMAHRHARDVATAVQEYVNDPKKPNVTRDLFKFILLQPQPEQFPEWKSFTRMIANLKFTRGLNKRPMTR